MRFIRRFEELLLDMFDQGLLNGTTHACIGQEADAVAVVDHLGDDDHIFSNHRCHGHFLARTGDALGLMTEIMGKPEGVCGGIGGSQHLHAPGFMSNGVQGGIVPNAAGIALAKQLSGGAGLSVVFIGDGTLGEGATYEALNLASLWKLPLVVVLEDNGWAQSTPSSATLAGSARDRFTAFGLAVFEIDSTDVQDIALLAGRALARNGAVTLNANTVSFAACGATAGAGGVPPPFPPASVPTLPDLAKWVLFAVLLGGGGYLVSRRTRAASNN